MLRKTWARGCCISDDLEMRAISENWGVRDAGRAGHRRRLRRGAGLPYPAAPARSLEESPGARARDDAARAPGSRQQPRQTLQKFARPASAVDPEPRRRPATREEHRRFAASLRCDRARAGPDPTSSGAKRPVRRRASDRVSAPSPRSASGRGARARPEAGRASRAPLAPAAAEAATLRRSGSASCAFSSASSTRRRSLSRAVEPRATRSTRAPPAARRRAARQRRYCPARRFGTTASSGCDVSRRERHRLPVRPSLSTRAPPAARAGAPRPTTPPPAAAAPGRREPAHRLLGAREGKDHPDGPVRPGPEAELV